MRSARSMAVEPLSWVGTPQTTPVRRMVSVLVAGVPAFAGVALLALGEPRALILLVIGVTFVAWFAAWLWRPRPLYVVTSSHALRVSYSYAGDIAYSLSTRRLARKSVVRGGADPALVAYVGCLQHTGAARGTVALVDATAQVTDKRTVQGEPLVGHTFDLGTVVFMIGGVHALRFDRVRDPDHVAALTTAVSHAARHAGVAANTAWPDM